MPPLQRQPSARRRSLTKPEEKIFAVNDEDRDGFLCLREFASALADLKSSEKKPTAEGDAASLAGHVAAIATKLEDSVPYVRNAAVQTLVKAGWRVDGRRVSVQLPEAVE